ncbi:hypothetical protein GO003_006395 [Methylicorpusculum oleiharenae]|uniref:hypothetical protein n=1 Tax=Methylicorpusculum oleiharenae TaxID=1338687 RepID=UPI00135C8299|nr:hypothetical protein [Methylicorpusculum oleiharenae]MCD2450014.1 hypothetical protein [Methylicorpusculum oleiharenae]
MALWLFLGLLAMPLSVAATVFNPIEDVNFELNGDTVLSYDLVVVAEGVTVSFTAPENSRIELVSKSDILIEGVIKMPVTSTLTLNSKRGNLAVTGTIFSEGLYLKAKEGSLEFESKSLITPREPIATESGLLLSSFSWYSIQYHPEPEFRWSSGSVNSWVSSPASNVPLPSSVLFFISGLLSVLGIKTRFLAK